jgi:hypothetical protein
LSNLFITLSVHPYKMSQAAADARSDLPLV